MIKVIWLTSVDVFNDKPNKSGTWISSMFENLKGNPEVAICACITLSKIKKAKCIIKNCTTNYYMPYSYLNNGLPSEKAKDYVVEAINSVKPDIIHIWGTETCLGLISCDLRLKQYIKLVDIQGIKSVIADFNTFYGGLCIKDIKQMNGLLQFIYPSTGLERVRLQFSKWGKVENEILNKVQYINTQSEWVRSVIPYMSNNNTILRTGIILRDNFLYSRPWHEVHTFGDNPIIFTTTAASPHKGFHVTLKAFALLMKEHSGAKLKVAGISQLQSSRIKAGYGYFLYSLAKQLGILANIEFLGNLDENELLENMYKADVFICSSYIETYCLAVAEAVSIGLPTVSSYSSAIPELVENGENGFLFPIGDFYSCAVGASKFLKDHALSINISKRSSTAYRNNHSMEKAVDLQIQNYKFIYSNKAE